MKTAPLVSVVMPVYNVAPWIEDAAWSILRQTYRHIELIVVDDGSTDSTLEKVSRISDPRIRIIETPHQGLFRALNAAILEARGRWVARMDGDDICHPERIERQLKAVDQNRGCVLCGTGWGFLTPNGRLIHQAYNGACRRLTSSIVTTGMKCADASMLFEREASIAAGLYDVDVEINEKSLWYKLLQRGEGIEIGSCLYFIRVRDGSMNVERTAAQTGRVARQRYDPQGYTSKYGKKALPSSERFIMLNIKKKLMIFKTARDYQSFWVCLKNAWRCLSKRHFFLMSSIVLIGFEFPVFWKRAAITNITRYVFFRAENESIRRQISEFGIHAGGPNRLFSGGRRP
jgi:glycosyltransferase involved in cell wall biosynthesis